MADTGTGSFLAAPHAGRGGVSSQYETSTHEVAMGDRAGERSPRTLSPEQSTRVAAEEEEEGEDDKGEGGSVSRSKAAPGPVNPSLPPGSPVQPSGSDSSATSSHPRPSYEQVVSFHGHCRSVSALSFSPDGTRLASAGSDRVVQIWYLATGSLLYSLKGHTQGISDLAWSPDSTYVASGSDDKLVHVWNADKGTLVRTLAGHMSWIMCVAFSPQGNLVASGGYDETLRLWDLMRGSCLKIINAHTEAVTSVDFSPDGAMAATGSYDGLVRLWNVLTGQCLKTLVPQIGPMMATVATPVASVQFSSSSSYLLASTLDNSIRLWDVFSGKTVKTYTGHRNERYPSKASFTQPRWVNRVQSQEEAVGPCEIHSTPRSANTFDSATHSDTSNRVEQNRENGHEDTQEAQDTQCRPSAVNEEKGLKGDQTPAERNLPKIMVVCGAEDQKVWIWDLQTKEVLQTLQGHTDVILALAVHPTLPILATGSMEHDPSIRIWMDTSDDH